ncbi:MAG TPA: ABC transporter substrate-binding protein [Hyphomicrobiales bacterium]|nr:ABC transporter substrate-binding protein [Hyphomicrobiales bacterium]
MFLRTCIAAGIAGALTLAGAALASATAPESFAYSVGVPNVPPTALIDVTARDLGLWQKAGIEPHEPPSFDRRHWTPELENQPEVRMYGMGAALNYMAKGVQFVIVADLGARAEWHVWTLKESAIHEASQIKGKRIAVTQMSGTDRLYADVFLNELGLSPKDVTFVPTGGLPQNYGALKAGKADLWVTTEHAAALIDRAGLLRSVTKLSNYLGNDWDPYVIMASRRALTERPAMVKKATGVLLQAAAYVSSHHDEDITRLMTRFKVDRQIAEKLFSMFKLSPDGAIHVDRIARMRDYYVSHGVIPRDKAPALETTYSACCAAVVK